MLREAAITMPRLVRAAFLQNFVTLNFSLTCLNMSVTEHQPRDLPDSDEELSDEQIQQLLDEAERSARLRHTASSTANVPLRLPKLNPGHIADVSLTTSGSITRLDPSKLINREHRALAEGIKKVDDPIVNKQQKLAVCTPSPPPFRLHPSPMMKIIPISFP